MNTNEKVMTLFYALSSYAKSIYDNLKTLCELEQAGKKDERSYFITLDNLKELLNKEANLYKTNIDLIVENRGELFFLATNNANIQDKNKFDLLSEFDELTIYERIKSKLKYYINLNKTFHSDILSNLKINYYDERTTSESLLDESFLTDMQRMSLYYMDTDHLGDNRNIEYKYLTALIFNLDKELADNYFEISKKNIYMDSTLAYDLNGLYKEIYVIDLTEVLMEKFNQFVDYISYIKEQNDPDCEYKVEIALNYLKSILDLLPIEIKEEFFNEFIMEYSDDGAVRLDVKLLVMNAMRNADRGRKLLKQINLGSTEGWF